MNFSHYSVFLDVDAGRYTAWSIAIIGLSLNIFIICFMLWESSCIRCCRSKRQPSSTAHILKSPSLWLLFNLFISDLFGSIYAFILSISDVYYTHYYQARYEMNNTYLHIKNVWFTSSTCTTAQIFGRTSTLMAATFTLFVAIDRLILVVYPHSKRKFTMKTSRILSVIGWIFGLAFNIGVAIFHQYSIRLKSPYTFDYFLNLCLGDFESSVVHKMLSFLQLGYFLIVYATVTVIYIIIIWRLRKSRLEFHSSSSSVYEKRFQIMLILISFTGVFAFYFISITSFTNINTHSLFRKIFALLPFTNAAIDPLLYLIFRQNEIRKKICGDRFVIHKSATIKPVSQAQETKSSRLERSAHAQIHK